MFVSLPRPSCLAGLHGRKEALRPLPPNLTYYGGGQVSSSFAGDLPLLSQFDVFSPSPLSC